MDIDYIDIADENIRIVTVNTVVVGSGASAYNAAVSLHMLGQSDVAIVTEGRYMGTSRSSLSDKQAYYKLGISGGNSDSPQELAKSLFNSGSMDGDIAHVEANMSAECFFRLKFMGVDFPQTEFGEYIEYKSCGDTYTRASTTGMQTAKDITKALERVANDKNIRCFDNIQVIKILVDKVNNKTIGLIGLDKSSPMCDIVLFNCTNIVYATGAPAGLYKSSAYPISQTGSTGVALEAGVMGKNLMNWHYGISSIKNRTALTGVFQQVIPRYISTDRKGKDEREFLDDYFTHYPDLLNAIFHKGARWQFSVGNIADKGSSLIDILVDHEINVKKRRVFIDYKNNPTKALKDGKFDFSLMGEEAYDYLKRNNLLYGRPIDRLTAINSEITDCFKTNGLDLNRNNIEINIGAQHHSGGLCGNTWWESNITHLFPVGEVSGSEGVQSPRGSSLNSGQVGSLRAAQFISANYNYPPLPTRSFMRLGVDDIQHVMEMKRQLDNKVSHQSNVFDMRDVVSKLMTKFASISRNSKDIKMARDELKKLYAGFFDIVRLKHSNELPYIFQNRSLLITAISCLTSMADYIDNGGVSRGSYMVQAPDGTAPFEGCPASLRYKDGEDTFKGSIQELTYNSNVNSSVDVCNIEVKYRKVNPIPTGDQPFDLVWGRYKNKIIYK